MMLPAVAVMSSDHFLNWSRSSGGTPSMWAITVTGSGKPGRHDLHAAAGQRRVHRLVHHLLMNRRERFDGRAA